MIHRIVPAAELDADVDELVAQLARSATVAVGLTKWLLHSGRDDAARRAPPQRGVRHGAVLAERRLPRGAQRVPREAATRLQGRCAEWLYDTLLVERQGPVGWLVFNRPEVGNAMDHTMMNELEDAWRELDADPAVRVIVNTGEGKTFQTGLDVAELSRDKEALREQSRRTRDAELALHRVAQPGVEAGDRGGATAPSPAGGSTSSPTPTS